MVARQRGDARRAVVPHRRAGEPARRDVVPDRPARTTTTRAPRRGRRWSRNVARARASGRTTTCCRCSPTTTTKCATSCPPNFGDDLLDKPDAQRQWRWDQQHGLWGYIDPADKKAWLRHLDYYVKLHQMADESLGTVLRRARGQRRVRRHGRHLHLRPRRHVRLARPAVEGPVRLRRDHARAVLRPGARRDAGRIADRRARHARRPRVDDRVRSAASIPTTQPSLKGVDLSPVLADPTTSVRDHVLFAHDTAHTNRINNTRYAIRGFFDGQTKYARYYGVGGGKPGTDSGARTPATSSTTSTPTSTTRSTSGTTSTRTRTSWSTSRTTAAAAPSSARTTTASSSTSAPNSSSAD